LKYKREKGKISSVILSVIPFLFLSWIVSFGDFDEEMIIYLLYPSLLLIGIFGSGKLIKILKRAKARTYHHSGNSTYYTQGSNSNNQSSPSYFNHSEKPFNSGNWYNNGGNPHDTYQGSNVAGWGMPNWYGEPKKGADGNYYQGGKNLGKKPGR